jgi:HSP20 family protein
MIRRRRDDELAPEEYWWTPYGSDKLGILNEMDRLMEEFRSGLENSPATSRPFGMQALRTPAVDIVDTGSDYRLMVEMPGIKREDVDIEIGDRDVRISAETNLEEEGGEGGYIRRERSYSKIYRRIPLPDGVRTDSTSAEMKDGLLTIRLPKISPQEKISRKVEIK